jgi:RNA polymerase sigma factor (sigma-70 family)
MENSGNIVVRWRHLLVDLSIPLRIELVAKAVQCETLRQVRSLFELGTVAGMSDVDLLKRFRTGQGEISELAFSALVSRHGPAVFTICARLLGDRHAAEDAFQATFLVLVRGAGSLRFQDSIGPWLHEVARRVSACARAASGRRKAHERNAMRSEAIEDDSFDDLDEIIREEVARLPDRYRRPLLLCDLEERTYDEVARRLACPIGTVKSRLARGRALLKLRLTRRGLAPSAVSMAWLRVLESRPSLPEGLEQITIRAATRLAASQTVGGAAPAAVLALTEGVMKTMAFAKFRIVAASVVFSLIAASGAAVLARQAPTDDPRAPTDVAAYHALHPDVKVSPQAASPSTKDQIQARFTDGSPTNDEVWAKFLASRFTLKAVDVEAIAEKVESCREYPNVGPAERVRKHFKCTITFDSRDGGNTDHGSEVVYIDKEYFRPCDDKKHIHGVVKFDRSTGTTDPASLPSSDQERRLAAVEKKLDAILSKLDGVSQDHKPIGERPQMK